MIMKEIAILDVTDKKRLVLSIGEYKGDERIDLRQNILIDKNYIPTRKGITFNVEWIDRFIEMIEKLRSE